MKRVNLTATTYIDVSEEEYNDAKDMRIVDQKTKEPVGINKALILDRGMVLLVPLGEFEEVGA